MLSSVLVKATRITWPHGKTWVLLLADEPTGNLDEATSNQVFDLILEIARETGLCALIATHNPNLAAKMDRTLRLQDRRLHQE